VKSANTSLSETGEMNKEAIEQTGTQRLKGKHTGNTNAKVISYTRLLGLE